MANYSELGYDEFLTKSSQVQSTGLPSELDPAAIDQLVSQLSGSKIQGGTLVGQNTSLNLDSGGLFTVSDGATNIVELGKISETEAGLVLRNRNGVELLRFTGDVNLMQSPSKAFQVDFTEERILAYNEFGVPVALFGKHEGGF